MKESEVREHRRYLVTHDGYRQIGFKTLEEVEELLRNGQINELSGTAGLDRFEISVYTAKLILEGKKLEEDAGPVGNREIADYMSKEEDEISRNAIARARRRIAHKMGFKPGW